MPQNKCYSDSCCFSSSGGAELLFDGVKEHHVTLPGQSQPCEYPDPHVCDMKWKLLVLKWIKQFPVSRFILTIKLNSKF